MNAKDIILNLMEIGSLKFGTFTLKSGIVSPIYIDLRLIVSYPKLLKAIATLLWEKIEKLSFDMICAVPYTALPIATAISLAYNVPMVMRRKEAKEYGTKKIIEGVFQEGQKCLVIEDLITSGISIFETIAPLEKEGLQVQEAIVLIDREQGGKNKLSEKGYQLHSAFTLSELIEVLLQANQLNFEMAESVKKFVINNQVK